jgi:hypothetical protein
VQIASAELDGLKREIENVARQQQIAHNKRRMVCLYIIVYRVGGQLNVEQPLSGSCGLCVDVAFWSRRRWRRLRTNKGRSAT